MKQVLSGVLVIIGVTALALGDVGTLSVSEPTIEVNGWNVEFTVDATTSSPGSPGSNDILFVIGQIYYPKTWTNHTISTTADTFTVRGGDLALFDESFSFSLTAPTETAGEWSAWVGVWGLTLVGSSHFTTGASHSFSAIPLDLPAFGNDLAAQLNGPEAASPEAAITVTVSYGNLGPGASSEARLSVDFPVGAYLGDSSFTVDSNDSLGHETTLQVRPLTCDRLQVLLQAPGGGPLDLPALTSGQLDLGFPMPADMPHQPRLVIQGPASL